jgi:Zn-dependent metalloprotease
MSFVGRSGRRVRHGLTAVDRRVCQAALAFALVLIAGCKGGQTNPSPPPPPPPPPPPARLVRNIQNMKDPGGRVGWSAARNLIALDLPGADGYFDVYVMNPDGSGERCLTCDKAALPNKHIGNPEWHPSGAWVVFQAQSRAPGNDDVANPGSGARNNIWVMDSEGQRFFQITDVDPRFGGVLHPHFSHRGDKLLWAERVGNSADLYGLWALKVADFRVVNNIPRVENIRTFRPGQQKFYESHGFTPDDRQIIFSGNLEPGLHELGIDIYLMDLETNEVTNLTNTPNNWDEHAHISPGGSKIVWMSSADSVSPVLTDYWMMNLDGSGKERITFFNQPGHADFIAGGVTAADSSWNADGTKIVAYVILSQRERSGRIVMLDLSRAIFDEPGGEFAPSRAGAQPGAPAAGGRPSMLTLDGPASPAPAPAASAVRKVMIAPASVSELRAWDVEVTRLERRQELVRIDSVDDPLVPGRRHERFVQVHQGVRVYGGELTRQTADGQTVSLFGTVFFGIDTDVAPAFSARDIRSAVERTPGFHLRGGSQPQLVVLPFDDGRVVLAYETRLVSTADLLVAFVDARSGHVLDSYSDVQAQQPPTRRGVGPIRSGHAAGSQREGAEATDAAARSGFYTLDMRGDPAKTMDLLTGAASPAALDGARDTQAGERAALQVNARLTHELLWRRFKREGISAGVPTVSVTRALPPADAIATGSFPLFARPAFYAGGGVVVFGETTRGAGAAGGDSPSSALDIVAHEIAHGVIEYSSKLIYRGESGALNEAFADIMGTAVEFAFHSSGSGPLRADYLIGEDAFAAAALRSLQDPSAHNQADHYERRFIGAADNGGVHVNSGIASHAFYLAVEGGAHAFSGVAVEGVGAERRADVERVFYRAFVHLLPANATFALARAATEQSARDLLGNDPAVHRALSQAWSAVGVPPAAPR